MALKYQGGLKLPEFHSTKNLPIIECPVPPLVTYPLENALFPTVRIGDTGPKYDVVAMDDEGFSVSSAVSGRVVAVENRYLIIESKPRGETTPEEAVQTRRDKPASITDLNFERLVDYCKKYGITGAFSGIPLHKKLTEAFGQCERLIINCVESDPASGHVRAMVNEMSRELVLGIKILLYAMGVKKAVVALDKKYEANIVSIKKHIDEKTPIVPAEISVKYPIGNERLLLNAIYNTEISFDKEVWQAGYPVFSAETVINLYLALRDGLPVTTKVLSVNGDAVAVPKNIRAPLGTPFSWLFSECGINAPGRIVPAAGGLLNAVPVGEDAPVLPNSNVLLAMKEKRVAVGNCLKCARCTQVCPMHLVPFKFHENYETGKHDENIALGLYNCIECGLCSYMCVGKVDLLGEIRVEKYRTLTKEEVSSETMIFEPLGIFSGEDKDEKE